MLTYLFAVLAACANAASSVLQRMANRDLPQSENLSWKLIRDLLHEPVWFGGVGAVFAGFLFQAAALGNGELSVVEPILVLELPGTLLLASWVFGSAMHWREWGSAIAMTVGLAGLLYVLSPSAGTSRGVHWYAWVIGIGANVGLIAALVGWARRELPGSKAGSAACSSRRAAVLGVAAGSSFGMTAALMKGMTQTYSQGIVNLFTSWQLYGMIAAGGLGMFLLQSALNAGRLIAAQPALTLSDPLVAILWGVLAFHERVRGGLFILLAVLAGALMAASAVMLAHSPLVAGEAARAGRDRRGGNGQRPLGGQPGGWPDGRRRQRDGPGAGQQRQKERDRGQPVRNGARGDGAAARDRWAASWLGRESGKGQGGRGDGE
jgi:drug/metabolite transporter (DMT)-like permease